MGVGGEDMLVIKGAPGTKGAPGAPPPHVLTRAILDAASVVVIIDKRGVLRDFNPAAGRIFDHPRVRPRLGDRSAR